MPRINSLFSGRKKLQGISFLKVVNHTGLIWTVDGMVQIADRQTRLIRRDDILTKQRAFSLLINRYMGDAYVRYGEKLRK